MSSPDDPNIPRLRLKSVEHTAGTGKVMVALDGGTLCIKNKDFIDNDGKPIEQRCKPLFSSVDFGTILFFFPEDSIPDEIVGELMTEALNVLLKRGVISPTDSNIDFNSDPDSNPDL